MFCKFIKLTNGDNIIAYTEDSCESFKDKEFVEVYNPIQIGLLRFPRNGTIMESHMFMPWIAASSSDNIKIPISSILVTTDVRDSIVKQYDTYINRVIIEDNDEEEDDEELSASEEVEEFLSMFNDESEVEEDDSTSNRRTIH